MLLHYYDSVTKEYTVTSEARIDPVASEKAGKNIYVTPPYATNILPPDIKENEVVKFNEIEKKWDIIEDHRGLVVYNKKDGKELKIETLGPIPEGYVLERPVFFLELKEKKMDELNTAIGDIQRANIQYGEFEGTLDYKFTLKKLYDSLKEDETTVVLNKNKEAITLNKEEIKKLYDFYDTFDALVHIKISDTAKEIRKCKNKASLDKVKIDFNVADNVKELLKLSEKEREEYIHEHTHRVLDHKEKVTVSYNNKSSK